MRLEWGLALGACLGGLPVDRYGVFWVVWRAEKNADQKIDVLHLRNSVKAIL